MRLNALMMIAGLAVVSAAPAQSLVGAYKKPMMA